MSVGATRRVVDLAMPLLPEALCQWVDGDWHDPDERSPATRRALVVCRACPERIECGTWALDHQEDGVWGAMTRAERDQIRAQCGLGKTYRW